MVIADAIFTAGAVVVQWSGRAARLTMGYSLLEPWIIASLALFVIVGLCWLPVVWIQLHLRDVAAYAARQGAALPAGYFALFRVWFWLGWPAFSGVIAIFALMIWKPRLW